MRTEPVVKNALLAIGIAALVAVAASPASSAQDAGTVDESKRETSMITFYGHVFGLGRGGPMPMNVEYPWGEEDLSQGFLASDCNDAVPDPGFSCTASTQNELWLYTTAGFVQTTDAEDFRYADVHNERGLTKDTFLDTSKDITATFYMSADSHGYPVALCSLTGIKPDDVPEALPCWNWDPGYLPNWVIEATVYVGVLGEYGGEANTAPDVATAFESGSLEILAQGRSAPQNVQSLEAAGQPTVWKFDVNLGAPQTAVIPKEKSYLVRFKWFSDMSGTPMIISDDWNVNSGEFYPPSVTIPVKNAFDVESVIPQFVHDKLVLLGIINTPWGSYDVDQKSVALTITNDKGQEVEPVRIEQLADYSVAHGGHYKPVNVTWVWDYKADNLAPGTYTAKVSASNYQHSAKSECSGTFTVLDGGRPGSIKIGECAVVTLTDEQLANIQDGASSTAAGGSARLPDVPLGVGVASVGASAVPSAGSAGALVAGLAAALALIGFRGRWLK